MGGSAVGGAEGLAQGVAGSRSGLGFSKRIKRGQRNRLSVAGEDFFFDSSEAFEDAGFAEDRAEVDADPVAGAGLVVIEDFDGGGGTGGDGLAELLDGGGVGFWALEEGAGFFAADFVEGVAAEAGEGFADGEDGAVGVGDDAGAGGVGSSEDALAEEVAGCGFGSESEGKGGEEGLVGAAEVAEGGRWEVVEEGGEAGLFVGGEEGELIKEEKVVNFGIFHRGGEVDKNG